MSRYFFNIIIRDRKPIADPDGDLFAGDKEVRAHAKMVAREMLDRRLWYSRGLERWAFLITDKNRRQVGVAPFSRVKTVKIQNRTKPSEYGWWAPSNKAAKFRACGRGRAAHIRRDGKRVCGWRLDRGGYKGRHDGILGRCCI